MPGVPDDWITNCAETLSHRLDTEATDQSVEQLCLFLTTMLISEPGENCDPILPSRQRQLLTCFEALQRAATPPKVAVDTTNVPRTTRTLKPNSSESDTDETDTDTGTESDTDEYESARDSSETKPESAADDRMNQKDPDPASKLN
jgi:hypothetical protein